MAQIEDHACFVLAQSGIEIAHVVHVGLGAATAIVLAYVVVYVGLALFDDRPGQPYYQFTEGKSIDVMSAVFMSMVSAFAWATFLLHPRGRGRLFWLLTGLAFLFFAVDELRHYHERMGDWMLEELGRAGPFRNWNDVLVLIYGVAGIAVSFVYLPEVVRYRRFTGLLGLGFLMFGVHTAIDGLVSGDVAYKDVPEETAKLCATAFFALAMLAALLTVARADRRDGG